LHLLKQSLVLLIIDVIALVDESVEVEVDSNRQRLPGRIDYPPSATKETEAPVSSGRMVAYYPVRLWRTAPRVNRKSVAAVSPSIHQKPNCLSTHWEPTAQETESLLVVNVAA
jgi:hypothetical protein